LSADLKRPYAAEISLTRSLELFPQGIVLVEQAGHFQYSFADIKASGGSIIARHDETGEQLQAMPHSDPAAFSLAFDRRGVWHITVIPSPSTQHIHLRWNVKNINCGRESGLVVTKKAPQSSRISTEVQEVLTHLAKTTWHFEISLGGFRCPFLDKLHGLGANGFASRLGVFQALT